MVELSTLSKYPFLNASKKYVKDNDLSVEELLDDPLYERARITGIERLDNAFKNRDTGDRVLATESDCIMELLSYPIARMIAVCIQDIYFKRRYALGEASHAYKNLINESTSFLIDISKEFNLNVKYYEDTNKINIYFVDYLHYAPTRYKEWKMINRDYKYLHNLQHNSTVPQFGVMTVPLLVCYRTVILSIYSKLFSSLHLLLYLLHLTYKIQ